MNKEFSSLAGALSFKCGQFLAVANVALITTKHIHFSKPGAAEECTPIVEKYPPTAE